MRKISILYIIFFLLTGCAKEPLPETGNGNVIVLMYHRIVKDQPANLYERSITDLEADIKYLINNNIEIISFHDLEDISVAPEWVKRNYAVITFDDGDHSWFDLAMPVLLKYKCKAVFFLWVSMIEKNSFLTWEQITLMGNHFDSEGEKLFTFGSHSLYHQSISSKKPSSGDLTEFNIYLDEEFGGSKKVIEANTPFIIDAFSLPFGDGAGDQDIINAAIRHGYKFIRTSEWEIITPSDPDLYRIPSIPILDETKPSIIGHYLGL